MKIGNQLDTASRDGGITTAVGSARPVVFSDNAEVHGDSQCGKAAVRARERAARERADRYLEELEEEVGEPSPEAVEEARVWCDAILRDMNVKGLR